MKLYLDEFIGSGGFSRVYVARITSSSSTLEGPVVVKKAHVTKHVRHPALQHEACAFLLLKGHPSTPDVYAWGRSQYYEYLAMERLGQELGCVLKAPKGLTMRNLIVLLCQMLDAIEHVHVHGLVHCDLKPENFIFTLDGSRLKLIDFGLARKWRHSATGSHIGQDATLYLLGTVNYASIPVHRYHVPSRRDDFESFAYTVVKLLRGRLPWVGDEFKFEDVLPSKLAWSGAALCAGYPAVFAELVDYARALTFEEAPDYARWRRAIRDIATVALPHDAVYEPEDSGGVLVGKPGAEAALQTVNKTGVYKTLSYGDDDSLPDSDDDWFPTSSWPMPHIVKEIDLIGDEASVVKTHLERIEEPPAMKHCWLAPHLVEVVAA